VLENLKGDRLGEGPEREGAIVACRAPARLVVFDVDGTLVDSQHLIVAAQQAAFAGVGLSAPSRQRSLSIVGLSLAEAFTDLVGPDGPVAALVDGYKAAFGALRADPTMAEPLYAGAAAVVDQLAARGDVLLGIATGKSRRGVAHLMARHGWDGLFHTIQTADDAPSKPNPAMLRNAMRETGTDANEMVMLGDTTFDMLMAKAVGCRAIGVSWGYHPVASLWAAGADAVIERFDDLATVAGLTPPAKLSPAADRSDKTA
jgi:phosphoglycolate phosphatase